LVHWAAALPHSNGRVGMTGPSYLGIIQLLTAARVGPGSPLKAIFPVIAGHDLYRDTAFAGGITNIEFGLPFLAAVGALHTVNPLVEHRNDPGRAAGVIAQHLPGLASFQARLVAETLTGGERAYDESWWMARNPSAVLDQIVANGVPAFMVGGWNDLFQRGAPLTYAGLQNASVGRPVRAPMDPGQRATGRYQLLMGPWYHLNVPPRLLERLQLSWFDTWLKDQPSGIADTDKPLHLYDLAEKRFFDVAHYPLAEATPSALFLNQGGTLTSEEPTTSGGSDPIVSTGVSSPCSRSTSQWGAGGFETAAEAFGMRNPCATEARTQLPPGILQYTSAPFEKPAVLAGPIGATLYATSTRPDTQWVATLEDVAPDGTATALTSGWLLGSFRELDSESTWVAPDGRPILPHHPYTRASVAPVVPGEMTRYDIEVFPTVSTFAPGHSLRLTITTSDTPHLLPNPRQLVDLAGGVYAVSRQAGAASFLEIPLADPGALRAECSICQ
ncbi:MAG: CocE/NonD family hydrolase, partial [Acidimicrobiia bacterium]